jgi:BirA family transcriptional regulator, biotin operon repressor / biotin---[acetyl-CoA-carboxylase] ligase
MPDDTFPGSAESIWQAVMAMGLPSLAGFSVEILPEIDSTNTELMRRARAGRTEPTLLVAQHQTAGRGRLGRPWHSDAPTQVASSAGTTNPSLTFSLGLLLQPQAWDGLSLAVGVSVATSLHPRIQLKWPNDLWVDDCKLAGILIETQQIVGHGDVAGGLAGGAGALNQARFAVIGVGINIAPRPPEALSGLSTPPAALVQLDPSITAAQALQRVATPLLRDVLQFEREGFAAFAARFAARDALADRPLQLSDGTQGTGRGVDAHGALRVHTASGEQRVSSNEVSVRPAGSAPAPLPAATDPAGSQ